MQSKSNYIHTIVLGSLDTPPFDFTKFCIGPYSLDEINMIRDKNPEVSYVEPGYKNYDCYIPSLIRIYK